MKQLIDEINIDKINESYISLDTLKNSLKEYINSNTILKCDTTFEGVQWCLEKENTKTYEYIYWTKLYDLVKFKRMTETDILVVKCWAGEDIIDGAIKIKPKIDTIIELIATTENFNEQIIINNTKGDVLLTYLNQFEGRTKHNKVEYIREFLCYLEENDLAEDVHLAILQKLSSFKFIRKDKKRKLPNETDMLTFDYYLKYFFDDKDIEDDMKLLFYPILIWWKVTNIIPMRPSEICVKLKRDCLDEDGDKYYIHVERGKVDTGKNKGRKSKIPILKRIPITKEIFDLLNLYKEKTEWDKQTKTFISYRTIKKIREKYKDYSDNLVFDKINEDYFTASSLSTLLDKFYKDVIEGIYQVEVIEGNYNLNIIEDNHEYCSKNENKKADIYEVEVIENDYKIKKIVESIYGSRIVQKMDLGDTRHIAFTSLLLQGVSPIEIAMLGGHTSIMSQEHYQGHSIFYADSEIINLVSERNTVHPDMDRSLKEILFSKPKNPPRELKDCMPSEDGVGYCTIDINSEKIDCKADCLRCKYWWCEPTNENYIILEEYLKINIISPIEEVLETQEKYLKQLLSQIKTENVNGLLELDKNYEEKLGTITKKIRTYTNINRFNIKALSPNKNIAEGLQKILGSEVTKWLEQDVK